MASLVSSILGSLATPAGAGFALSGLGAIGESLFGRRRRRSRLTPGQERIREQIELGLQGQGPFADAFGPVDSGQLAELFQQTIADPAQRRFTEQIIPQITVQIVTGKPNSICSLMRS